MKVICSVPLYAIVDIETTHGTPTQGAITEIAVLLSDGQNVTDRFVTLVNPGHPIPPFITGLTGITDTMVAQAPSFNEIAPKLRELLAERIFVAHNVSFDYQFIRSFLTREGTPYQSPTLCTVRMSRKAFPGYKSYGLGNICESLKIKLNNRHRALGDAEATAILFHKCLEILPEKEFSKLINRKSKLDILPPNLPSDSVKKIPTGPGIYYLKDESGQVLYVGKALDIKKRLAQHFSEALKNPDKNHWWRRVAGLDFLMTGTEWMAFLVERLEIKKLWPEFNRAQKQPSFRYGIVFYTNSLGEHHLAIDKLRKGVKAQQVFTGMMEAREYLHRVVSQFDLCPGLCQMGTKNVDKGCALCLGQCPALLEPDAYYERIQKALGEATETPSHGLLMLRGRHGGEKCVVWFRGGYITSFGYIPKDADLWDEQKYAVRKYEPQPNSFAWLTLRNFMHENPDLVFTRELAQSEERVEYGAMQFQLL